MMAVGADIWKGRWMVVALLDGQFASARVASSLDAVREYLADAAVIGIDVPIGLPSPGERRESDRLTRAYIGPRWPSLFSTPSIDLLEAPSHAKANELARAQGRRGISAQAYGLRAAILEVQVVARTDERMYEVHPEASFVRANGGGHLTWPKTSWNGAMQRRRILAEQGIVLPDDLGPAGVAGPADVLDAAIAAWSANRIALGTAVSLPEGAERVGAVWGSATASCLEHRRSRALRSLAARASQRPVPIRCPNSRSLPGRVHERGPSGEVLDLAASESPGAKTEMPKCGRGLGASLSG